MVRAGIYRQRTARLRIQHGRPTGSLDRSSIHGYRLQGLCAHWQDSRVQTVGIAGDRSWRPRLALELDPTNADAHNTLGRIALSRKEWAEAEEHFLEACESGAEIHSYVNASIAADMDGDLDWSETMARIATVAEPENPMPWLQVYGICCQRGDWKEARVVIDEALAHSPESHELLFARAELRLHAGDAVGWFDYESRPTRLHLSHLDEYPEWSDESLVGCTLLRCESKDLAMIMFARFLSQLRAEAKRVVVFTYPDMARVMADMVGAENVITREADIPDFDYWVASWFSAEALRWDWSLSQGRYSSHPRQRVGRLPHLQPPSSRRTPMGR